MTTSGNSRPDIINNSIALSNSPESLQFGSMTGMTYLRSSPIFSLSIKPWRAVIQLRFPRSVLISPLWATQRNGWARAQLGSVLVEKREWTIARWLSYSGFRKSS